MHRALQVQEIIVNIFDDANKDLSTRKNTIVALARTCKTFKELALDFLWAELSNLSPLVRCLGSEITVQVKSKAQTKEYNLRKNLEQANWDIILGYACRVKALTSLRDSFGLTKNAIGIFSNPPIFGTMFPNLRHVCLYQQETSNAVVAPMIRHLAAPKVTGLWLYGLHTPILDTFGEQCPMMTKVLIKRYDTWGLDDADRGLISQLICHWQNLCSVECHAADLSADALIHLSRLPNLSSLSLAVNEEAVDKVKLSTFTFPVLCRLELKCDSSMPADSNMISNFLRHIRIPVIRKLLVYIEREYYSADSYEDEEEEGEEEKPNPMSILAIVPDVCGHGSLNKFILDDSNTSFDDENTFFYPYGTYDISFDRLHALAVFTNIKSIQLRYPSGSDMIESEVLCLASSWPRLEKLVLDGDYAWKESEPPSGITPGGFLELLEKCRLLRVLHIKFNTRGYTEVPKGHPWRGLSMPEDSKIIILDAPIEEESIEPLAVFFHVAPFPNFLLWASYRQSSHHKYDEDEDQMVYEERWRSVREMASDLWKKRNLSV